MENTTIFLKLCLADALFKLMETKPFSEININEICKLANVSRSTYYRNFSTKDGKSDLLTFKLAYELDNHLEKHKIEGEDNGLLFLKYIYDNKKYYQLLYKNELITSIMNIFEYLANKNKIEAKASYLMSFFTYGYFGIIYTWIKKDFKETPEEILQYTVEVLLEAQKEKKGL